MFDVAPEDLLREGKLYDPNIDNSISKKNEVEYAIGGAAVFPAAPRKEVHLEAQNAVPEEHQYPPLQPAPEPAPPEAAEIQPAAPVQVHFDSPEPGVSPKPNPKQEKSKTRTEMSDSQTKSFSDTDKNSTAQSTPAAWQRVRFDPYDYPCGFPSRQDLTKKVFYAYLEQQATTLPSVDTKRTMLRNIAPTTRQKPVKSTPPAPNLTQISGKSILKNRYPIRSK